MIVYLTQYEDFYTSHVVCVHEDEDKAVAAGHEHAAWDLETSFDEPWGYKYSVIRWDTHEQITNEVRLWERNEDIDSDFLRTPEELFDRVVVDFEPWPPADKRRQFYEWRDERKEKYREFYNACKKM